MMTNEIYVNGVLIGHVYIHNLGYVNGSLNECNYEYEYYQVGKGNIKKGEVLHHRTDGSNKLLELVFKEINK